MTKKLKYPCELCEVVEAISENSAYCQPCQDKENIAYALEKLQWQLDFSSQVCRIDKKELIAQLVRNN